jgi:TPR repeat protein
MERPSPQPWDQPAGRDPLPDHSTSPPPLPSYDAAAAASSPDLSADLGGGFNAMRISDPFPRSNTSMSQHSGPPPTNGYSRLSTGAAPSVRSLDMGGGGGGPNGYADGGAPYQPYPQSRQSSIYGDSQGGWVQQQQQQPSHGPYGGHPPPPTQYLPPPQHAEYSNPYYAAASGVLGYPPAGGHPPGPSRPYPPPMPPIPQGAAGPSRNPNLSRNISSVSSVSGASLGRSSTSASAGSNLARSGTSIGSSNAKRQGSLATVDARKPPYTKAFVDEYRTRMKGDPDPEAQFAFAKYLIEAAKKLGEEVGQHDAKSGRKYRDALLGESLKLIKKLATQSDEPLADAQFFLADLYGTGGLGLQSDPEKAYGLYLQASKQNHPAACYRTAVCNELGAGTRKELNRAILFFRKAASLGDTTAMYRLGMVLLEGKLGQPANVREGIHWLRKAAAQADETNPHALHELGTLHENPPAAAAQFVEMNHEWAREFYTQAAQLGYAPSQLKLGTCYEYGNLTCQVDPRRSIAWYTKAAEKGNAEAELALSGWYLTGSGRSRSQRSSFMPLELIPIALPFCFCVTQRAS